MPPFFIDIAPWDILTPFVPPNVAVPEIAGLAIVVDPPLIVGLVIAGLVSVLFVSVSVVVLPTSVSVVAGKVKVILPPNAECAGAWSLA